MISSRGCAVMSNHKLISGKIVTKGELRITVLYNGESSTEEGAQSVSYTHLDVYKRQAQTMASIPASMWANSNSESCLP